MPVNTHFWRYLKQNTVNVGKHSGGQWSGTVDGSEILRSPVGVGSLSHYLQGFSTIPGGCLGFLPVNSRDNLPPNTEMEEV